MTKNQQPNRRIARTAFVSKAGTQSASVGEEQNTVAAIQTG
ncbi:MAG: hypothetical protein ACK5KN_15145 [Dysgonomonas sp.]|jgi:hypothetical protein|nr:MULTISPECIES: hypothetical protein [unclassified Dysgonomonas]HMM04559.1 hypothetical protein [Dysgonomonas sp.]